MQYNRVEICGVNTSKLKVLKEKEKTELLRRMHSGDRSARDELIKRKSAPCSERRSALYKQGREPRRPLSGRVHRAYKGY